MGANVTITKRTTITLYGRPTVDELVDALGQVPESWRNGRVDIKVHSDQRDGTTITITVDAT
ncbi:hypothetical protein [Mycobacterium aquaticum]|uniref:Uncharacterized protein n=1 Tax=Mycobacterium aquaticum TaxID=1927124 RepID=A0A1X0A4A4_9MYCO|nr:hypothetical protein [Mycobacterium aquaticum]ORA24921.1 hypothetical protein BST13_33670 [Mycobacterium aquaticum]